MGDGPRSHPPPGVSAVVRFSAEAEEDIASIYGWYERARIGLGRQFIEALDAAVAQIEQFPEAGRVIRGDVRRILTRRFPYGLSYLISGDDVVVLGCFHL